MHIEMVERREGENIPVGGSGAVTPRSGARRAMSAALGMGVARRMGAAVDAATATRRAK
jgi:hypothetical protein